MASHAPPLGTLKYSVKQGSVTFPGDVNTRTSSRQVMTADGRAIKWVEHTLTVDGWLFSSDLTTATGTVDGAFDALKEILSQQGGQLRIVGKGFGDIDINANVSINRDIAWGPIPKVIDWQPFGNIVCKFKWEVSFTLPWRKGVHTIPGILDYWWATSYKYDAAGFCDRTISGELEMTGSRYLQSQSVDRVVNIEDNYRKYIRVDCPLGFHRTGHDLSTNPAKTKVMFTFTDEQDRGLTYPPGICDMDVTHEMSAQANKMTISQWIWSFHASAVPDARYPTAYGYQACLAAFESRFKYMMSRLINSNGAIVPFPVSIKVGERVKTRTSTLSVSWVIMTTGTDGKNGSFMPIDILSRSGMWQPFEWTAEDHKKAADSPLGPNTTGGFTQMATDVRQNIILDISSLAPYIPDPGLATGNFKKQLPPKDSALFIQPYGAYLDFKVWVSCRTMGNMWVNYPVTRDANDPKLSKENIHEVTKPYNEYALRGYILRCGIPPAGIPKVSKIGGRDVEIPAGKQAETRTIIVSNNLGLLIWRTDFWIPYTPVVREDSNPVKAAKEMENDKPVNAPNVRDNVLVQHIPNYVFGGAAGTIVFK